MKRMPAVPNTPESRSEAARVAMMSVGLTASEMSTSMLSLAKVGKLSLESLEKYFQLHE